PHPPQRALESSMTASLAAIAAVPLPAALCEPLFAADAWNVLPTPTLTAALAAAAPPTQRD
ncbi:hypothetical protein CKO27_23470, partial [Thiocystis violacea]|nr:hypothetical protein [Thiocystis violacea]